MNLQACRIAVDFGLLILIWLVQLIIYPSFEFSAKDTFIEWHERYTGLITIVVLPLMLAQLALTIFHATNDRSWPTITCLVLTTACWVVTFTLSVPAHNQLQAMGNDPNVVKWLVLTNWLRTACWTGVSALSLSQFMLLSK